MNSFSWIGKAVPRIDGAAKVRGKLKFPSDIAAPDMLHCRPVLAPHPHATLLAIHTEDALAIAGVVRVLTHADVPGSKRYGYRSDHPVLVDDKTRCIGDMVAVVVAESEAAAAAGAKAVVVDYAELPLITDPVKALEDGSPLVHDGGNVLHQVHYDAGDVDAIFGREDVVIVESTYRPQCMDHAFLETEGGFAFPEDGGVRVISGGQNAYYNQQQVAPCLGLPMDKVRMVEPFSGGAFGGKGDITVHIVVALAAWLTGRPCRMVWTRREHALAGVKRHPYQIRLRTAATRAGDLLALDAHIVSDTGAYAVFGDSILELTVENIAALYRIPNIRIHAWAAYTNNPVGGAFRGFGATQGCLALEGNMSQMARQLGMDQLAFRERNLLEQGEQAALGHTIYLPFAVGDVFQAAARHPAWTERETTCRPEGRIRRGIGVAVSMKGYGLGLGDMPDWGTADVEVTPDGRLRLGVGIVDIGQGSFTAMAQMAAEVLRISPSQIDVHAADTRVNTDAGTTAASRVTYAVGRAVVDAAEALARQLKAEAATHWGVPAEEVALGDGMLRHEATGRNMACAELAPMRAEAKTRAPLSEKPTEGALAHPHALYSSNLQIAQVAIDTDSGEVEVERVVSFPDAGRVINLTGLVGQCDGGVLQGVGYALMEKVHVQDGRVLNPDWSTYQIPTAADMPLLETEPVETLEASGPFGAKGMAENATVPTAPAILDAIEDAIGVRFTEMPVTPEQVLRALGRCEPLTDV